MEQLQKMEREPRPRIIEMAPDYQPVYPDQAALVEALDELRDTTPVTTFDNIDSLRHRLSHLGESGKVYIAGRCANNVDLDTPIQQSVDESLAIYNLMKQETGEAEVILRDARGQSAKPRSQDKEVIGSAEDGEEVYTYKGDMINGLDPADRTPDPSRMVAAAIQARDIEEALQQATGQHIPHAHEALLLAYEGTFIYEREGKKYLLSADLPWIGERTRHTDGAHVELLSRVDNPVGVKLSASAQPEDIVQLAQKLNPDRQAGKLIFMLRLGVDNLDSLDSLLQAIRDEAPESIIMCDPMHGNTKKILHPDNTSEKIKTRLVRDIIKEARRVAEACQSAGLKLHGLHLEAMSHTDIKECVDSLDEVPAETAVDPNLNLNQLRRVIQETRDYL